jgi:glycosyltransferase involved in cell wall biosynthesis
MEKLIHFGGLRTKGITKQSQKSTPLITVITVVRNGEKTIEKAIESVINQTYKNIEYIIIDGASTDNTIDIIKKYKDNINYWISEPDEGIYYAMNKGIDLATGEYIAFLNSNDWYEDTACETISEYVKKYNDDVYYGLMKVVSDNHETAFIVGYHINSINHYMISHPSTFIKTEILCKNHFDIRYKYSADYALIISLLKQDVKFRFIEKILVNFSTGGVSENPMARIETLKIQIKNKFITKYEYYLKYFYYFIIKRIF